MNKDELQRRTKEFALRAMKLVDALPRSRSANAVAKQLVRSGTSVASNYRAACQARSRGEFIAKIACGGEDRWWQSRNQAAPTGAASKESSTSFNLRSRNGSGRSGS